MNGYAYYPGCSLKENSRSYEQSLLPVFKEIGVPLEELNDWNCCGATAYFSVDEMMAAAVSGRNLSLAEKSGRDILAPCAGCYLTLKKSNVFLASGQPKAEKILGDLKSAGCEYHGTVKVKHPLEVLVREIGLDALRAKIRRPLTNLKVACYYGCQLVRPFTDVDDADYPMILDDLMAAAGATAVDFAAKTRCCGGSLTGTIEEVGLRLNYILLKEAKRRGRGLHRHHLPALPIQPGNHPAQDRPPIQGGSDSAHPLLQPGPGAGPGPLEKTLGFSRSIIPLDGFRAKLGNGGAK